MSLRGGRSSRRSNPLETGDCFVARGATRSDTMKTGDCVATAPRRRFVVAALLLAMTCSLKLIHTHPVQIQMIPDPGDGLVQAFFQADFGLPAQALTGP